MSSTMWVVVRCSGARTIEQTNELLAEGWRVWTPVWHRKQRLPRTKKVVRMEIPCLPSYVFIGVEHIDQVTDRIQSHSLRCQLMVGPGGKIVRVSDRELKGLRDVSNYRVDVDLRVPRPKLMQRLKFISGPFQGLIGEVSGLTTSHAIVDFGMMTVLPVHFPYLQLHDVTVHA